MLGTLLSCYPPTYFYRLRRPPIRVPPRCPSYSVSSSHLRFCPWSECVRNGSSYEIFSPTGNDRPRFHSGFRCTNVYSKGAPNAEPYVERVFRGATNAATGFVLSVLSKAHPCYPSLADQFANKWIKSKPTGGVSVEKIFTVEVRRTERGTYECLVTFYFENPDVIVTAPL